MSEVKIQGLLAKESEITTGSESQNKSPNTNPYAETLKLFLEAKKMGLMNQTSNTDTQKQVLGDYNYWGHDPNNLGLMPQKMSDKFGSPNNRTTPSRDSFGYYEEMMKQMRQDNRSDFEKMVDTMFSPVEKLDFLKSLGYEHVLGDKVRSNKVDDMVSPEVTESISQAFLREITRKFKNLLLAKGSIKLKF